MIILIIMYNHPEISLFWFMEQQQESLLFTIEYMQDGAPVR